MSQAHFDSELIRLVADFFPALLPLGEMDPGSLAPPSRACRGAIVTCSGCIWSMS